MENKRSHVQEHEKHKNHTIRPFPFSRQKFTQPINLNILTFNDFRVAFILARNRCAVVTPLLRVAHTMVDSCRSQEQLGGHSCCRYFFPAGVCRIVVTAGRTGRVSSSTHCTNKTKTKKVNTTYQSDKVFVNSSDHTVRLWQQGCCI